MSEPEQIENVSQNHGRGANRPDAAAIGRAQSEVSKTAKDTGKKVKELFEKVFELEQLSFFNEPEFEEALLLPSEELEKRYTGEHSKQIEYRRELAIYMLSRECPVEDIARLLHMNIRLVQALAAQNARKLAAFTEQFAHELLSDAASDIALARTKRGDASYKDLHVGAGIKMQHAAQLRLIAEVGEKPAIDAQQVDDRLAALREKIRTLKPPTETP